MPWFSCCRPDAYPSSQAAFDANQLQPGMSSAIRRRPSTLAGGIHAVQSE
jgi:hypothetical protein